MIVEDVTPQSLRPEHSRSTQLSKVVTREFRKVDAVRLANFGRLLYRFYACIEDMFPENETVLYPHIFQHIAAMKDEPYYAEALKRVGDTGVDL